MSVESGSSRPEPMDKLTSAGPSASGAIEVSGSLPQVAFDRKDTIAKLTAVRNSLLEFSKTEHSGQVEIATFTQSEPVDEHTELSKSEEDRLIRQTHRLVRKRLGKNRLDELYESTGLTPEMVSAAKQAARSEYWASTKYVLSSESISTTAGWVASQSDWYQNAFDIKNLIGIGAVAAAGRLSTIGMLGWKGHLNDKRIKEVDGVATDPLAKLAHEKGKGENASWKGYVATNGLIEGYYASQTAGIWAFQGPEQALIFDSAASWVASGKLLVENLYLTNKLHKARAKKNEKKSENVSPVVEPSPKIVYDTSGYNLIH